MVGRRYARQKTSIYFWKTTEQMTFQRRNWLIAWELILESDSWWKLNRRLTLVWTRWVSVPLLRLLPLSLSFSRSCRAWFFLVSRSAFLRTLLDLLDTLLQEIIIPVCVGKVFLLDSPFFSENVDVENSNSFLFFRQLGTGKERFCVLDRSKVLDVEHKIYNTYRGRRVKGEHLLFLLSRWWYVSRSGFVCGNRAEEIAAESGGDCFLECCCSRQRSFFHGFVFISWSIFLVGRRGRQ